MAPRCGGVKGRGRIFPRSRKGPEKPRIPRRSCFPGGGSPGPSVLQAILWAQAGPHASGCDEPGQVGRSSPKSFPRVPWQARPFCACGAEGPDLAIAQAAPSRIGTGMSSSPGPDSAGSPGACSITRRSPTWQARPFCACFSATSWSRHGVPCPRGRRGTAGRWHRCCGGARRGSRPGCRGGSGRSRSAGDHRRRAAGGIR